MKNLKNEHEKSAVTLVLGYIYTVRGQNPRRTKSLADKIPAIWSARTKSPRFLWASGQNPRNLDILKY